MHIFKEYAKYCIQIDKDENTSSISAEKSEIFVKRHIE